MTMAKKTVDERLSFIKTLELGSTPQRIAQQDAASSASVENS